jgi:hypothetical protein
VSTTATIITLAFGYAFVLALVVASFTARRAHPWLSIAAAVISVGLFYGTYVAVGEVRGFPSDSAPPEFFKLHWARVVEPNPLSGDEGRVFLWLEELDEDNYPSGTPRAYELPYSLDLVRKVDGALASIQSGEDVAGRLNQDPLTEETAERLALEIETRQGRQADSDTVGERVLNMELGNVNFMPLPAPVTPEKPL